MILTLQGKSCEFLIKSLQVIIYLNLETYLGVFTKSMGFDHAVGSILLLNRFQG